MPLFIAIFHSTVSKNFYGLNIFPSKVLSEFDPLEPLLSSIFYLQMTYILLADLFFDPYCPQYLCHSNPCIRDLSLLSLLQYLKSFCGLLSFHLFPLINVSLLSDLKMLFSVFHLGYSVSVRPHSPLTE